MIDLIIIWFLAIPPFSGEYCTVYDKDFSRYRYEEQIPVCKRVVSTRRKNEICRRDGILNRAEFTVDHIIPLSLGGNNSDENLWCQHRSISTASIENYAFRMVDSNQWSVNEGIDYVMHYKFRSNN